MGFPDADSDFSYRKIRINGMGEVVEEAQEDENAAQKRHERSSD